MTDLLDKAAATARSLPPEKQDEIARAMLAFIGDDRSIYQIIPNESACLDVPDAEPARKESAAGAETKAVLSNTKREVGGV